MRSTDHPAKRVKTSADASSAAVPDALSSLSRAVSPPPLGHVYQTPAPPNTDPSRKYLKTPAKGSHKSVAINISESDSDGDSKEGSIEVTDEEDLEELVEDEHKHDSYTRSPFTLTRIRDLPDELNKDTIGIEDILGDVMLREVWIFNFCINVAWTMSLLDPDIRDSVTVKFVYGRARKEVTDEMAVRRLGNCVVLILITYSGWYRHSQMSRPLLHICPRRMALTTPSSLCSSVVTILHGMQSILATVISLISNSES